MAWLDNNGVTYSADKKILLNGNSKLERYQVLDGCEVIDGP